MSKLWRTSSAGNEYIVTVDGETRFVIKEETAEGPLLAAYRNFDTVEDAKREAERLYRLRCAEKWPELHL